MPDNNTEDNKQVTNTNGKFINRMHDDQDRHTCELSLPGADGTMAWRDGPDGFFK